MKRRTGERLIAGTAAVALLLGSTACGASASEKFSCDPDRVFNYGNGTDFGTRPIQVRAAALAIKDCSADAPLSQAKITNPGDFELVLNKDDGTVFVFSVETTGALATGAPNSFSPTRVHTEIYKDPSRSDKFEDLDLRETPKGWTATRAQDGQPPLMVPENIDNKQFRDVSQETLYWLTERASHPFKPLHQ